MRHTPAHFSPLARLLHWSMALMIIAMLFIGAGMVASVSQRHAWLLDLHRPLGIAILLLAIVRVIVRVSSRTPALPGDLPAWQKLAATLSHYLLYALMLAMPLIGWAMVSAAGDPVMLTRSLRLPALMSADAATFAFLRQAHTYLAYLLFVTVINHLAAALFHAWIRRDEVMASMARGEEGVSGADR
jgi:cytochrome b561